MDATKSSTSVPSTEGSPYTEDLRLAAAVLRKDRKATAEFVNRYSDVLHAYLRRRLIPRMDLVDDLLQEVFLAAWANLSGFRARSSLQAWLLGIARHKVEDHYRARLREPEPLLDGNQEPDAIPSLQPLFDRMIDRKRLEEKAKRVLGGLPESYSAALLWRYWEKRSTLEMSQRTGKTVKAMERLLARAREQFRRRWNDE